MEVQSLRVIEGIAEKTRGVPDTRTSDRASWFQKRKGDERSYCHFESNRDTSMEFGTYLV